MHKTIDAQPLSPEAYQRFEKLTDQFTIEIKGKNQSRGYYTTAWEVVNQLYHELAKRGLAPRQLLKGSSALWCLQGEHFPKDIDIAYIWPMPEGKALEIAKRAVIATLRYFYTKIDEATLWDEYLWKRVIVPPPNSGKPADFLLYGFGPSLDIALFLRPCRSWATLRDSFVIDFTLGETPMAGSYELPLLEALRNIKEKKIQSTHPEEVTSTGFERYITAMTDGFCDESPEVLRTFYKALKSLDSICAYAKEHHEGKGAAYLAAYYHNARVALQLLGMPSESIPFQFVPCRGVSGEERKHLGQSVYVIPYENAYVMQQFSFIQTIIALTKQGPLDVENLIIPSIEIVKRELKGHSQLHYANAWTLLKLLGRSEQELDELLPYFPISIPLVEEERLATLQGQEVIVIPYQSHYLFLPKGQLPDSLLISAFHYVVTQMMQGRDVTLYWDFSTRTDLLLASSQESFIFYYNALQILHIHPRDYQKVLQSFSISHPILKGFQQLLEPAIFSLFPCTPLQNFYKIYIEKNYLLIPQRSFEESCKVLATIPLDDPSTRLFLADCIARWVKAKPYSSHESLLQWLHSPFLGFLAWQMVHHASTPFWQALPTLQSANGFASEWQEWLLKTRPLLENKWGRDVLDLLAKSQTIEGDLKSCALLFLKEPLKGRGHDLQAALLYHLFSNDPQGYWEWFKAYHEYVPNVSLLKLLMLDKENKILIIKETALLLEFLSADPLWKPLLLPTLHENHSIPLAELIYAKFYPGSSQEEKKILLTHTCSLLLQSSIQSEQQLGIDRLIQWLEEDVLPKEVSPLIESVLFSLGQIDRTSCLFERLKRLDPCALDPLEEKLASHFLMTTKRVDTLFKTYLGRYHRNKSPELNQLISRIAKAPLQADHPAYYFEEIERIYYRFMGEPDFEALSIFFETEGLWRLLNDAELKKSSNDHSLIFLLYKITTKTPQLLEKMKDYIGFYLFSSEQKERLSLEKYAKKVFKLFPGYFTSHEQLLYFLKTGGFKLPPATADRVPRITQANMILIAFGLLLIVIAIIRDRPAGSSDFVFSRRTFGLHAFKYSIVFAIYGLLLLNDLLQKIDRYEARFVQPEGRVRQLNRSWPIINLMKDVIGLRT